MAEIGNNILAQKIPGGFNIPKVENPKMRKAKGLELLIINLTIFIVNSQSAVVKLLFGKYEIQNDETKNKIQKAFDKGLIYVISKIAAIDFCKIIRTGLNAVRIGNSFDPLKPPLSTASNFEKRVWSLQNTAYKTQSLIDKFYATFGTDIGQDMRVGLKELLINVNQNLNELRNPETGIANTDVSEAFPETKIALNYINSAITKFSSYANVTSISQEEVQTIIKWIDNLRITCIAIQSLNTPANLISTVDRLTGGNLDDEMTKMEEFIGSRGEPLKFIKYLLKQANKMNSVARSTLGYVNLVRTVVKLLLFLIKAFSVIRAFLTTNLLPLIYSSAGAQSSYEDFKGIVIDRKGIANFVARLQQFDTLIREIAELITILIAGSNEIINKLNLMKLNLENCNPEIAKEIDNTIQETKESVDQLSKFLNDINNAVAKTDTTFGPYKISIVSEQLVDEGIRLKRRYGIAQDSNNNIVVESTPTFASLDQIIINEVKFLLVSKGLVKSSVSSLSPDNAIVYENAIALLGEDAVEFSAADLTALDFDSGDKQDTAQFVDNLPGGSSFRKKSRSKMIAQNEKLLKNLKSSDPNSKYTESITKTTQQNTNKLKIEKLEDEKRALQASIAAIATNPVTAVGIPKILQEIKQIDAQIESLKRS